MNQTQLEAIMKEQSLTKKRAVISIAIAVICHGCYSPDLSKVRYTCSITHPLCPDGQECIEGWCGGPSPSAADAATLPPQDMTAPPPPPDMAQDCRMCKSGRCIPLPNNTTGCYAIPGSPLATLCQGTHRIAQFMPWTEAQCAQTPGRWLGAVWQWGTATSAATPPLTTWWNSQPQTGATYRYIAACGTMVDSGWAPAVNGWQKTVFCKSGQAADRVSEISCPRGPIPSDADWDLVTSSSPDTGVICVLR